MAIDTSTWDKIKTHCAGHNAGTHHDPAP